MPHDEIKFFAAFFMGRAGSAEITDEERNAAQKNFNTLAPLLDEKQKAELHKVAMVIYDSESYESLKKEATDFIDQLKSYLDK